MDAPASFESFLIHEGERKIVRVVDTKVTNSAIFKIFKEDHTLASMIRDQLLKDPKVVFAGYKIPHPQEYELHLRIQTTNGGSPHKALKSAIADLLTEVTLIEERFKESFRNKREEENYMDIFD